MQKFRKKPVVIEAIQFNPEGKRTLEEFGGSMFCQWRVYREPGEDAMPFLSIETLEGTMRANSGDWIIRGVKGEYYPCKPDIFAATYEPVEE
jgi:hypothetical protein